MFQLARRVPIASKAALCKSIDRMNTMVENVVYQHAENVCSLWLQRQNAVDEPHYSFNDILHLDNRLEANLEGLRVAGTQVWPLIDELIDAGDEGAYFTKALLTLEADDKMTFAQLLEMANESDNAEQILLELESALAWSKPEYLRNSVKHLLSAEDSASIILGLKACMAHNRDPSLYLEKHVLHPDTRVRSTVINAAANGGNTGFKHRLINGAADEPEHEAFERARALALLGEQSTARPILARISRGHSSFNSKATQFFMLLDDVSASRSLLKELDGIPERQRDVVQGFGLIGDPQAMNWLIDKTAEPKLARLAGGAITMITGVDLSEVDLEQRDAPEGYEDGGLSDDPNDDHVALDEDEDLPWPDTELIKAWWSSSPKLTHGKRFLDGREKVQPELIHVLANGMQRQRNAAATSLALLQPDKAYLDTRLPTNKQKAWMS